MITYPFFLFLTLLSIQLLGQKEGLYWYFGVESGLKFHQGYPQLLTDGRLNTVEGCATISSPEGELLMYTDGVTVFGRNHQPMPNGSDLMGSPDATQSGIIVPVPNDTNRYYLFTVSSLGVAQPMNGFRYSLVDMRLNDGMGGVVYGEKNKMITPTTTERVTSVFHENEYGIWVIMHEWESSRFRSYLVTSEGIDIANPVISDVGLYHGPDGISNRDGIGYLKVSPDGSKLAVAIMGKDIIQVFDFDDNTGLISSPITLPDVAVPYGVEFSAGAEFLYATERLGNKIYQWDMQLSTPEDIINSREIVGVLQTSFGGAMQMAADGKIYIARKTQFHLSVINKPYLKGQDCEFQEIGVELPTPRASKEGLPTFIQSFFNNIWIINENQCIDEIFTFSLSSVINIDSVLWDFGDRDSGENNYSAEFSPEHIFSSPGTYEVQVTCYHLTTQTVINETLEVLPLPDVELGDDLVICFGDTVTLDAGPGFDSYIWMDEPDHLFQSISAWEKGNYWVQVKNGCGMDVDSIYLEVRDLPEVDLGKDTVIRYNEIIILDAGSGLSMYLWQDGSDQTDYFVDYPGIYWVVVADDLECKSSDTIRIEPVTFGITFPTAFSPNNDGFNDLFLPITTYEVDCEFEFMVFNRYGEMVFRTIDINQGWDGTYNNIPCPVEVYTWYMNVGFFENNAFFTGSLEQKGNVTLLR